VRKLREAVLGPLPALRRFAAGLSGSVADGDDLVQAACERVLTRSDQWREGTRFDSWVYRIVHMLWLDEIRRRRRKPEVAIENAPDIAGADGVAEIEARMTMNSIRAELARLPPEQRAVVVLVCVEGLSYREAAEILEIPAGTVMSRLARGRETLSARLRTLRVHPQGDTVRRLG